MKTYIVLEKEDLKELIKEIISEISAQKPDKVKVEKEEDKLFTADEACKILRCSRGTLHRWKKEGIIPHVRIRNNIRYKESDLKRIMKSKNR